MLSFRLAQEFKKRAADMIAPFPRGAVSTSATISSGLDSSRMGAYASLGAIALGGVMLVANIAHNRNAASEAGAQADPPAVASEPSKNSVAVQPLPQPEAAPVAAVAPPPASVSSPVAASEKPAARIDTSTTGAISSNPPAHPKHKPHPKKAKDLDSKT